MKQVNKLVFRTRDYADKTGWVDVWLILREGISDQCLMHGLVLEDRAKVLTDWFKDKGAIIEEEHSPMELGETQVREKTNGGLFKE